MPAFSRPMAVALLCHMALLGPSYAQAPAAALATVRCLSGAVDAAGVVQEEGGPSLFRLCCSGSDSVLEVRGPAGSDPVVTACSPDRAGNGCCYQVTYEGEPSGAVPFAFHDQLILQAQWPEKKIIKNTSGLPRRVLCGFAIDCAAWVVRHWFIGKRRQRVLD
jgi:hypothetical protein